MTKRYHYEQAIYFGRVDSDVAWAMLRVGGVDAAAQVFVFDPADVLKVSTDDVVDKN